MMSSCENICLQQLCQKASYQMESILLLGLVRIDKFLFLLPENDAEDTCKYQGEEGGSTHSSKQRVYFVA